MPSAPRASGSIIGIDPDVIQGQVAGVDRGFRPPLVQVHGDGQGFFLEDPGGRKLLFRSQPQALFYQWNRTKKEIDSGRIKGNRSGPPRPAP